MADDDGLLLEDTGALRTLTMNRPASKNAFNEALYHGFGTALEEAAADPAVGVVLVTGAGDAFSAGQDLKVLAQLKTDRNAMTGGFNHFSRALAAFDKPLIAAVNGVAVGAGATMLGHCDLTFASDTARFKYPFVALGMIPEAASSYLLPERIGHQAAAYYLLTGDWLSAAEACERGLVWKVCPPEALLDEARSVAARIASAPVENLQASKRMIRAARADVVEAANERELDELAAVTRRIIG